jgi:hypothetical protein
MQNTGFSLWNVEDSQSDSSCDASRSLFQNSYSCSMYNSMSSIHWYNQVLHRSNYGENNSTILRFRLEILILLE